MLKGESRDNDLVGRVGGEEFLAVLSNCGREGAFAFAERFRKRVEKTQIFFEGKRVPVTVSVGTATINGKAILDKAEDTAKEMVQNSDAALYHAKGQGRNQTRQSEDLVAEKKKKTKPKKAA